MIGDLRLKKLHEFFEGYSKEELIWVNGYLSGLVGNRSLNGNGDTTADHQTIGTKKITLAFGTETGNSKKLATQLAAAGKKQGVNVKLTDLSQYRITDLPKEEFFFIVISTQGEGEPPIPAKKFYDYIHENELSVPNLKFSVLALGDTSYPLFCKTGEDVDARFLKFGAKQVVPLQKCDVDYEEDALRWFEQVIQIVNNQLAVPGIVAAPPNVPAKKATGKKYYRGTILTNINLNDRGSKKATYHIEIGTDEPIVYEPGDTIGIVPHNRADVVDRILQQTGIDPAKIITTTKSEGAVKELLLHHLNICYLLSSTIKKYAALTQQDIPDTRMDLVDLLRIYPVKDAVQFEEVIKLLLPIAPRLYSVSSSPAAQGEYEIHITVAKNKFLSQDEQRYGLCSEFLGDLPLGSAITFYVHKDKNFKLPATNKDVIMIGPGTGVAPFRSFLAERDAIGATGRNWFFFGEQHFTTDFLYQTEIQNYVNTGVLTKIDLAFSRDQSEKVYVQHRIEEKAVDFFQWIDQGASIYISGTKDPMSKDVEQTLLEVIEVEGRKTKEEAQQYLEQLKKEGRYEKDVY